MHPDIREKLTCVNLFQDVVGRQAFHMENGGLTTEYSNLQNCPFKRTCYAIKFWFIDYNCRNDPNASQIVEYF